MAIFTNTDSGQITGTRGRLGLSAVQITHANGRRHWLEVGALGVADGWNPNVALSFHRRGGPVWQDNIAAFVPGRGLPVGMSVAGAAYNVYGPRSSAASLHHALCFMAETL